MYDYLLPIGSVVLLRDGIKKLMITGIRAINTEEPDKEFGVSKL